MKLLCVHAHFDDFEFVLGGTFEVFRRHYGKKFAGRVVVCTDGQAGHHQMSRRETGLRRLAEQKASARAGDYSWELLRYPDGKAPREGCLVVESRFLAALWECIRRFEPDYLFCPPLPADNLVGVHPDHLAVADAVRRVAYMINVPHAFSPEYPREKKGEKLCRVPVILTVHDPYLAEDRPFDMAVKVESAFETIARETWCHQSQIREWLPWVGRHDLKAPASFEEWRQILRKRLEHRQVLARQAPKPLVEMFSVTAWGEVPSFQQLKKDFPQWQSTGREKTLEARLKKWRG